MLRRIDDYLLDRAQDTCHFIQRLTGITNFTIARGSLALARVTYTAGCIEKGRNLWIALPFEALLVLVVVVNIRLAEQYTSSNSTERALNPLRADICWLALRWLNMLGIALGLLGLALSVPFGLVHISRLFDTVLFATMVLTPLPPGQSKISEWINSMAAMRRAAPAGAGA